MTGIAFILGCAVLGYFIYRGLTKPRSKVAQ